MNSCLEIPYYFRTRDFGNIDDVHSVIQTPGFLSKNFGIKNHIERTL